MRPEELRALLNRRLFQPFKLHLTTGVVFEVRHPRLMVVGRSIAWLEGPSLDHPVPLARRRIGISLIHIVWIEFVDGTEQHALN